MELRKCYMGNGYFGPCEGIIIYYRIKSVIHEGYVHRSLCKIHYDDCDVLGSDTVIISEEEFIAGILLEELQ